VRYRVTNGLIEYFKAIYDKVVYAGIDDAYEEYEERFRDDVEGTEVSKFPALIALHRTSCTPYPSRLQWGELRNGRFEFRNIKTGMKNYVVGMEWDLEYDVTVLSSTQMHTDTLVDELLMYMAANSTMIYDSGVSLGGTESIQVASTVLYSPGGLGEIFEAEDSEESGTVYRTTFSIKVTAYSYKAEMDKKLNAVCSEVSLEITSSPTS
jgi:hypothetical protein